MNWFIADLIILDLGLPGKNGFDILSEIAEAPPSLKAIPIVILTNFPDFEYLSVEHYDLPFIKYLKKPCEVHELKNILSSSKLN